MSKYSSLTTNKIPKNHNINISTSQNNLKGNTSVNSTGGFNDSKTNTLKGKNASKPKTRITHNK